MPQMLFRLVKRKLAGLALALTLLVAPSAQAQSLPLAFLELVLESRPGRVFFQQVVTPGLSSLPRASLQQARTDAELLDLSLSQRSDLAAAAELLERRALSYGRAIQLAEDLTRSGDDFPTLFRESAEMTDSEASAWRNVYVRNQAFGIYRAMSRVNREFVIEAMNGDWGLETSLWTLQEFFPAQRRLFVRRPAQ
jgi:hypothetical protein